MASKQTNVSNKSFPFEKSKTKIFIDSSVLMSAAISPKGYARDLILSAFRGEVKVIISDLVLEETERNLSEKAPKALPAFQLFKKVFDPEIVKPNKSLVKRVAEIVDIKDAPIVAGAIQGKADFLVSFDRKHLLKYKEEIETNFNIKVATPDEVMKLA